MNVPAKRPSRLESILVVRAYARKTQTGDSGREMAPAKPMQETTAIIAESRNAIVRYLEVPSEENYTTLSKTLSGDMCAWCKNLAEGDRVSWETLRNAIIAIRGVARKRKVRDKFTEARKCVMERTGQKIPTFEGFFL